MTFMNSPNVAALIACLSTLICDLETFTFDLCPKVVLSVTRATGTFPLNLKELAI